jgi:phosphopentomutase
MYSKEGRVITYDESNSRTVVKTDSIVDGVIDKLISRAVVGKKKYGVTLDRNDLSLSEWLTHLQEELMDAVNYIERIKKVVDGEKRSNIN